MDREYRYFIYKDASGVITSREIRLFSLSEEFLQGYSSDETFRIFRIDRILEEVNNAQQLAERLRFHETYS